MLVRTWTKDMLFTRAGDVGTPLPPPALWRHGDATLWTARGRISCKLPPRELCMTIIAGRRFMSCV